MYKETQSKSTALCAIEVSEKMLFEMVVVVWVTRV